MICDEIDPLIRRTWAEIDINAVEHNFKEIRKHIGHTKICCVVKANAYGHGATELALIYEKEGADYLAVSNIMEATKLRENGITLPILILGYTDPLCASVLAKNNISQCVFSKDYGMELARHAVEQNVAIKVHFKLDTGMGRIGFTCKEENSYQINEIFEVSNQKGIITEGIFTHFASADEGKLGEDYTSKQYHSFIKAIEKLEKKGLSFKIKHCANSAAVLDYPDMRLDMVRAGIILYGLNPSDAIKHTLDIKPVMKLCSIVSHIKCLKKGEFVSYGRHFQATNDCRIATIPIGYADGLWRSNEENNVCIQLNNTYAPIVGRICMDQCMVDITNTKDVKIGSKVIIFGAKNNSINDIACANHTINYEIACSIAARVPRIYIKNSNIVAILDNTI